MCVWALELNGSIRAFSPQTCNAIVDPKKNGAAVGIVGLVYLTPDKEVNVQVFNFASGEWTVMTLTEACKWTQAHNRCEEIECANFWTALSKVRCCDEIAVSCLA
jgi:hypothetical protein